MEDKYTTTLTDSPDPADALAVRNGLEAYDAAHGVPSDWVPLGIFVKDAAGRVVAGLTGGTYWGWLYVVRLWVDEGLRGRGTGGRLLVQAEQEALRRGCPAAHLATLDFQALPFYEQHGYTVFGRLADCPRGHTRTFGQKELAA